MLEGETFPTFTRVRLTINLIDKGQVIPIGTVGEVIKRGTDDQRWVKFTGIRGKILVSPEMIEPVR